MTNKYTPYLNLAIEAATKAGNFLLENIGKSQDIITEEAREIHFRFDLEAEKLIIKTLQKGSNYKIISEECGIINASYENHDYTWIVDPLDGSINYSEGIPLSCISVSLWKGLAPVLGVIYDFNHDLIYTGVIGLGAWLNRQPIHVKPFRHPRKAILCTGFPAAMDFSANAISSFIGRVKGFMKIRMLGSAALSLAFVASGKVDAYYEENIKVWDVAAGLALVKAAGGEIICNGFPESHIVEAFGGASLSLLADLSKP